jgi:hypothetical protein
MSAASPFGLLYQSADCLTWGVPKAEIHEMAVALRPFAAVNEKAAAALQATEMIERLVDVVDTIALSLARVWCAVEEHHMGKTTVSPVIDAFNAFVPVANIQIGRS